MRYVPLIGRVLFAAMFLKAAPAHFQEQAIGFVSEQGIPFAPVLVPVSGFLALAGGLSVLLGWRAKVGAWLLVAFVLVIGSFIVLAQWGGSPTGSTYVPAHMEDGHLVPGKTK